MPGARLRVFPAYRSASPPVWPYRILVNRAAGTILRAGGRRSGMPDAGGGKVEHPVAPLPLVLLPVNMPNIAVPRSFVLKAVLIAYGNLNVAV